MSQTNWNKLWETEKSNNYWLTPSEAVIKFIDKYKIGKGNAVLDLGCGIGRHAILFETTGADVYAIDESVNAINELNNKKLKIKTLIANYLTYNYSIKFDYIISYNVIYHGDYIHFKNSIDLCYDLLNHGGKFFFTCPTRNDAKYGNGEMIAEHTYKSENSLDSDDIHYFVNENVLKDLLCKFNIISLKNVEYYWNNKGKDQLASNLEVIVEKPVM